MTVQSSGKDIDGEFMNSQKSWIHVQDWTFQYSMIVMRLQPYQRSNIRMVLAGGWKVIFLSGIGTDKEFIFAPITPSLASTLVEEILIKCSGPQVKDINIRHKWKLSREDQDFGDEKDT